MKSNKTRLYLIPIKQLTRLVVITISGLELPREGEGVDSAGVTGGEERRVHRQDVHLKSIPILRLTVKMSSF
jgi:hypothetical protein